jgi:RNA polymerase sigma-70 factor (ECF subfamily)
MQAGADSNSAETTAEFDFDAFYSRSLPIVYGYLLRLCGGDHDRTRDLTQDTWVQLVDELNRGNTHKVDIRWLITVARSRFLDGWRRRQRLERGLRLAWANTRDEAPIEPEISDIIEHLAHLSSEHRVVLTLRYLDGFPVADIAGLIGRSTPATYSLLARARDDLRIRVGGHVDD